MSWRLCLALALAISCGCAGAPVKGTPFAASPGWTQLVAGDDEAAARAFDERLAAAPGDLVAAFGRAALRYERGDDAGALADCMAVLEGAAEGAETAWAQAACAARVAALTVSLPPRSEGVERLLRFDRGGGRTRLPWAAQPALDEALDAVARRRGDAAMLAAGAVAASCVRAFELSDAPGSLPVLDLTSALPPRKGAPPALRVEASGCTVTLPALTARPGVRTLRAAITAPAAGDYDLVVDVAGTAAVRVDDGPWHAHGSATTYGPRISRVRQRLAAGPHALSLHVSSYGGTSEVRVFFLPARGPELSASAEAGPAAAFPRMVVADALGAVDEALVAADRLTRADGFAVGLAAAAAFLARDPTIPEALARDRARGLLVRAAARDERLARVFRDIAAIELERERPADALAPAQRAARAAPGWWQAELVLIDAYRARGFDRDADRVLDAALARWSCPSLPQGYRRAQQRDDVPAAERLVSAIASCDALSEIPVERARARGALANAEALLRARLAFSSDPHWVRSELAEVLVAREKPTLAARELQAMIARAPRDPSLRLRLADAVRAAGDAGGARAIVAEAVRLFPTRLEVRQAARVLGLPFALDPFRIDGAGAIAAFRASGRTYDAPAVLVLDRTVARAFEDGSQVVLTHNIVRVQTKDGIERWGEVQIPEGAEVMTMRTHKADGRIREPEDIVGKATVSAPELAAGDFIEWETVEYHDPADAVAPGFTGDRFFFQSLEAPLDLSELLFVMPAGTAFTHDSRAGAPPPVVEPGANGTKIVRFVARHQPQRFAERAAVPAIEWIPSVRVASGVSFARWSRFLADQLTGVARGAPALRAVAAQIAAAAGPSSSRRAVEVVKWVTENIELDEGLLESATATLARGRGNRAALMIALGRALGLDTQLALVRSPVTTAADAPVVVEEIDDFADLLVRFGGQGDKGGPRYVDPRLRKAPFGYLPPALDGAVAVVIGSGRLERTATTVADGRRVSLDLRLAEGGAAEGSVTEVLTGWPAVEWAEVSQRLGDDEDKLRQDFEQRWLAQHFAGAQLGRLTIQLLDGGARGLELSYSFSAPQLAAGAGGELKLTPSFFRSQPARRYATEGARRTTLLAGADIPLDLEARVTLPPGARVLELGRNAVVTAGARGEVRFEERRDTAASDASGRTAIHLRRRARLPLVRVAPQDYPRMASALRLVDPLEQAEIRFSVPAAAPAAEGVPRP